MNKYYIPDMEDLYVGYECEEPIIDYSSTGPTKEWKKLIIGQEYDSSDDMRVQKEPRMPLPWLIRTPYLNPKQLQDDRWVWKMREGYNPPMKFWHEKDNFFMCLDIRNETKPIVEIIFRDPSIVNWYDSPEHVRIIALCPSINEFRKLIKMLNDSKREIRNT